MDETQIKQIIERQPLHGTALLDPRCKILLLVCIGFVSYFLAGEVVSLALMLVYGLFITLGNGGKICVRKQGRLQLAAARVLQNRLLSDGVDQLRCQRRQFCAAPDTIALQTG